MTEETRNGYLLLAFVGLGGYLLYKNRPEPPPDPIEGEESDLQRTLMGEISRSDVMTDDLMRLKRKLDRYAQEFEPEALERGTAHEFEVSRNKLVAQKTAMDHLRENPDYYQVIDDVFQTPEAG